MFSGEGLCLWCCSPSLKATWSLIIWGESVSEGGWTLEKFVLCGTPPCSIEHKMLPSSSSSMGYGVLPCSPFLLGLPMMNQSSWEPGGAASDGLCAQISAEWRLILSTAGAKLSSARSSPGGQVMQGEGPHLPPSCRTWGQVVVSPGGAFPPRWARASLPNKSIIDGGVFSPAVSDLPNKRRACVKNPPWGLNNNICAAPPWPCLGLADGERFPLGTGHCVGWGLGLPLHPLRMWIIIMPGTASASWGSWSRLHKTGLILEQPRMSTGWEQSREIRSLHCFLSCLQSAPVDTGESFSQLGKPSPRLISHKILVTSTSFYFEFVSTSLKQEAAVFLQLIKKGEFVC